MAAWKPKEKQLTPEEAVELARKELAPYWAGSAPLLGGVRGADGRATAHPLDKILDKKAHLLVFVDPATYAGEPALQFARDWHKRYSAHELGFILIARASYRFMETVRSLEPFFGKTQPPFAVVLDREDLLHQAFNAAGADRDPKVLLLHQRKIVFERSGPRWLEGAEEEIQRFLRKTDPGLPLSLPIEAAANASVDQSRIELRRGAVPASIKLTGRWQQEDERIVTNDPQARLLFRSASSKVAFLAAKSLKAEDASRIRIELNGDPVFDSAAGPELHYGDDGGAELLIREPRLYQALAGLSDPALEIGLKFPDADRLPIALYGIRFGK